MAGSWTGADVERIRDRLLAVVARLTGVEVEDSFGHISFHLRRQRIAWLLVDHHGDGKLTLAIKAPAGELETLMAADPARYFRPAYVTSWVGVEMYDVEPDWAEVGALLEQAWRMRAGTRAVAAYDAAHGNNRD